jgi:hypothetical protein
MVTALDAAKNGQQHHLQPAAARARCSCTGMMWRMCSWCCCLRHVPCVFSVLHWYGVDAVALRWEGLLLLVEPCGEWLKRPCQGAVVMVTEVDGLRMVSSSTCSLLRRVPEALVQVCILLV